MWPADVRSRLGAYEQGAAHTGLPYQCMLDVYVYVRNHRSAAQCSTVQYSRRRGRYNMHALPAEQCGKRVLTDTNTIPIWMPAEASREHDVKEARV